MSVLLFDIGGTTTRMAVGTGEEVTNIRKMPTPATPEEAVDALAAYAEESGEDLTRAVGGVPGIIKEGVLSNLPHLPAWRGYAFSEELSKLLHAPVRLRNDAELAALGEATYGAGKGYPVVAYLGIGTGVGGALIRYGTLPSEGEHPEPGHQIIDAGTGATLEELVSGSGLRARQGKPAEELSQDIYEAQMPFLATGVYNLILEWSPDAVVLGGSLMNEKDGYRLAEVRKAVKAIPTMLPSLPPILHAALGDENGLWGALAQAEAH